MAIERINDRLKPLTFAERLWYLTGGNRVSDQGVAGFGDRAAEIAAEFLRRFEEYQATMPPHQAYRKIEEEYILEKGKRRYASYASFISARSKYYREACVSRPRLIHSTRGGSVKGWKRKPKHDV